MISGSDLYSTTRVEQCAPEADHFRSTPGKQTFLVSVGMSLPDSDIGCRDRSEAAGIRADLRAEDRQRSSRSFLEASISFPARSGDAPRPAFRSVLWRSNDEPVCTENLI